MNVYTDLDGFGGYAYSFHRLCKQKRRIAKKIQWNFRVLESKSELKEEGKPERLNNPKNYVCNCDEINHCVHSKQFSATFIVTLRPLLLFIHASVVFSFCYIFTSNMSPIVARQVVLTQEDSFGFAFVSNVSTFGTIL